MKLKISWVLIGIVLLGCLAGCGSVQTPQADIQTEKLFTITTDDFLTQFIGLTMREPELQSAADAEVQASYPVRTYTFPDNLNGKISYTLKLREKADGNFLTGFSLSSQLVENADKSGYSTNPFFGVYIREAIRVLEPGADFAAINANCKFDGTQDSDITYATETVSIHTVISGGTITATVTPVQ